MPRLKQGEKPKYVRGKYTPAQGRATNKYNKEAYDQIMFRVRKDADLNREKIAQYVEAHGLTMNSFVLACIEEYIKKNP